MATNKWMCTCNKGKILGSTASHQKLYPTEVDEEEICVYCGFYAYAEPSDKHDLYPLKKLKNGKWLREISRSRSEWYFKFGRKGKALFDNWEGKDNLVYHGFDDIELLDSIEDDTDERKRSEYIDSRYRKSIGGTK